MRANVRDVIAAYYFDSTTPETTRLHLVCDEVLSVA